MWPNLLSATAAAAYCAAAIAQAAGKSSSKTKSADCERGAHTNADRETIESERESPPSISKESAQAALQAAVMRKYGDVVDADVNVATRSCNAFGSGSGSAM